MIAWLVGVAVLVAIWGLVFQRNFMLALGILIGLPLAWILSLLLRPYITGMEHIPLWLPPLPFAIVATTLLIAGAITWFKADSLPPPPAAEDDESSHH